MSTGKQLSLWSGMTESQQNQVFHKTNAGKNHRIRIKQKCVTLNQTLIVKMRKELRPTIEIAKQLQLDANTVRNFLVKVFGDKDPLDIHVVDSFNNGESAKAIGRRLNINKQVICRILRKHEIDPWKAYLERESESFRKTGVPDLSKRTVRNPDRPRMIAEDLYCVWLEIGNIEDVAIETGYSASSISGKFTAHVPSYKQRSLQRRRQSKEMKRQQINRTSSEQFRFEKAFSDHCVNILKGYDLHVGRRFGMLETDLVLERNGKMAIIELKVTSKQKEIARGLGQLFMQREESGNTDARLVLCVPDDVTINHTLKGTCKALGIYCCSSQTLLSLINIIM